MDEPVGTASRSGDAVLVPAATIRSKFSVKIGRKAKPAPDLLCRAANVTVNHEQ